MVSGAVPGEHENPGEASVHVLADRVRLPVGQQSWMGVRATYWWVPDSSPAFRRWRIPSSC
jgi:hypothetical protein